MVAKRLAFCTNEQAYHLIDQRPSQNHQTQQVNIDTHTHTTKRRLETSKDVQRIDNTHNWLGLLLLRLADQEEHARYATGGARNASDGCHASQE
jgi:hypothetical protein